MAHRSHTFRGGLWRTLIVLVLTVGSLQSEKAAGVDLPIFSNFELDQVGQPPMTSAVLAHRPTNLVVGPSGTVQVTSPSLGMSSHFAQIEDLTGETASLSWIVDNPDPIQGTRVELTVVFDSLADITFIELFSSTGALTVRIDARSDGAIESMLGSTMTLGFYTPGVPFRIRIDIDRSNFFLYGSVDQSLDGFQNETVVGFPLFTPGGIARVEVGSKTNPPIAQVPSLLGVDDVAIFNLLITDDGTELFERGDVDGNGTISWIDPILMLVHFKTGGNPPDCRDAWDANDDGVIALTDVLFLLQHLFVAPKNFAGPTESCGIDPSFDSLRCDLYECP